MTPATSMSEVSFGGSFQASALHNCSLIIELGIIHHNHPLNQRRNNGVGLLKLEFTVDGQGFIFAVKRAKQQALVVSAER